MNRLSIFFFVVAVTVLAFSIVEAGDKKVVCYYSSWAVYREADGKMTTEEINPKLCTHMMYAFFGLADDGSIKSLDEWADMKSGLNGIEKFNKLKEQSPCLKTLFSIGGWGEGSEKYGRILKDDTKRKNFVKSAKEFMDKHGFDGVDLDWEYPGQRGGTPEDVQTHVQVLKELSAVLKPEGKLLSAAVGAPKSIASQSYNIPEINKYLDMINLMTYDMHVGAEAQINHNAPLYARSDETGDQKELNDNAAVQYWLDQGADPEKLILGVPLYGRTFKLADKNNYKPGAAGAGVGIQGPYTKENGMLGYNEICEMEKNQPGWQKHTDAEAKVPYLVKDNDWISYDDPESVANKGKFAVEKKLGGVMVWSIETDDFRGKCNGKKFPLLSSLHDSVGGGADKCSKNSADDISKTKPSSEAKPSESNPVEMPHSPAAQAPAAPSAPSAPVSTEVVCSSHNEFVRDPKICSIFYQCVQNGGKIVPMKFNCPGGLVFNSQTKACDWPQNVQC